MKKNQQHEVRVGDLIEEAKIKAPEIKNDEAHQSSAEDKKKCNDAYREDKFGA